MEGQTIATARIDIVGDASGVEAATAKAKEHIARMSKDAQAQYSQLSATERRRIDTMLRQAETIGMSRAEQIKYNAQLRASGPLLNEITKRIDASSAALAKSSKEFNQYGVSAAQQAAALRGVPAQITDIVVSLQGGQRPMTVLLQQGGQLKDMFGGIVPAAQALTSTLVGMINPATLSAGALAALGLAWYQGSREMDDFRTHLIMTNGAIGLSLDQLSQMADRMDQMAGVTRGRAVQALTEIAKSGKIAGEQIGLVGEVAIRSSEILGREISEVVDEFSRLATEPAQASAKLNEQYNYLTASVYEQIRALEEQGNKQAAAQLAQETYAQATKDRLNEVEGSLGYIERAWNAVTGAVKEAWDAMMGIGRETTLSDQIAETERQIAQFMDKAYERGAVKRRRQVAELEGRLAELRAQQAGEDFTAQAKAQNAQEHKAAIDAQDKVNRRLDDTASKADKARKEIEAFHLELADIRKVNPGSDLLKPENVAKVEKAIREKFKETGGRKAYSNDAATRMLMTLREQEASLRAQAEGSAKLTEQQKRLAAFEQQIADIKSKQTLTADEKSILAAEDKLRTQLQVNVAVEQEARAREAVLKFQERAAQISEQMATARENQNEQHQRVLDAFGLGDKAMERVQAQRAIYREFERYQRQLSRDADLGLIGQDRYREASDKIQAELQRRLAMEQSYYEEVDRLQASWALGAKQGLANYSDEAANVYQGISGLVTQSFKGMEEALANFVTKGKLDFSSLADSIIADMARIMIQQSITGPLAGAIGNLFNPLSGVSAAPNMPMGELGGGAGATFGPTMTWSSGGYTGDGGKYDVAGLVHRGEGVLNQEEIRALGGEAGFNALRQSIRAGHAMGGMAGRPGAVAGGGQYQAGVPVIINFHGASERPERAETKMGNQGLEIDLIFRQVERQIAGRVEAGSSPINQAFERRYGARPTF